MMTPGDLPNVRHSSAPAIVLVTGSLESGGAERIMADIANYWHRKGWSVTLATWSGPDVQDFYVLQPGVRRVWLDVCNPRHSLFRRLRANALRIRKLHDLLSATKPDAVLSFIDTSNVLTIMAAMGLNVRIVVSERIHPAYYFGIHWQWKALRKVLYRRADAVVTQTKEAASWIERKCRVRTQVIANPLRCLPNIRSQRESFVLAVGRLSTQKGFDVLLRAFGKICSEFDSWRVVIIGTGPERQTLLKLRDELRLGDRIAFSEPVRDIESWMSRASLVVQPSRFEGFPNVVLEAMGMGAAVISSDCPSGPSEIIEDRVNGRLVPVEDVDALARAMAELMAQPAVRSKLGQEAIKVREKYRQETIMAQWEDCVLPQS